MPQRRALRETHEEGSSNIGHASVRLPCGRGQFFNTKLKVVPTEHVFTASLPTRYDWLYNHSITNGSGLFFYQSIGLALKVSVYQWPLSMQLFIFQC